MRPTPLPNKDKDNHLVKPMEDLVTRPEPPTSSEIKDLLRNVDEYLLIEHKKGCTGRSVIDRYTSVIDRLLKGLFLHFGPKKSKNCPTAFVALGGYGRAELNVRSDVDFMLLYRGNLTPEIEEMNEKLYYLLCDTGLDLGFAIRSISDCLTLAREDLKTLTAILDRRLVAGDKTLYKEFDKAFIKKVLTKKKRTAFIKEKMEESSQRQARYGGSVYILEHNLKEGEGGLRDLHSARWVSIVTEAAPNGNLRALLRTKESAELAASIDFLMWVRNDLHFAADRKSDQLSFDQQERMARDLGYKKTENELGVETFMRNYYRHASNISRYARLITARSLDGEKDKRLFRKRSRKSINEYFSIVDNTVAVTDDTLFKKDPSRIVRAFEHSQSYDVPVSVKTRDLILEAIEGFDDKARSSSTTTSAFKHIIKKKKRLFKTISDMHAHKVIGALIPEFNAISNRVQHDMYHVYTVDMHTLYALKEFESLRGNVEPELFLMASILKDIKRPHVLVLGILLHDIGKSLGTGHAEKGADLVPSMLKKLKIKQSDIVEVEFLVREHLILANTAQYRDIHDEKLVAEFAKKIGSIDRLNMLFLLTFADVRAVGPEVWNQWKAALYQELYFKALTFLERGTFEIEEVSNKIDRLRRAVLKELGTDRKIEIEEYFNMLPQRYFLSNNAKKISTHINIVANLGQEPVSLTTTQNKERDYTELIVCTHDVSGLFAKVTGVMAANSVDILGAQIYTLTTGIALDILEVKNAYGELLTDEKKINDIRSDLSDIVTGRTWLEKLVKKPRQSILDQKETPHVPTRVAVDNEVSESYTVLDINTYNRIGLLYKISSALYELGLYIKIAKISTKGESVSDIFYILDIFGQKIYNSEKIENIIKGLTETLSKDE